MKVQFNVFISIIPLLLCIYKTFCIKLQLHQDNIHSISSIRFTINGFQCVFPFIFNNKTFTNCAIDEKTSFEWCYIDKFQIIKHECSRGNFEINSRLIIKSSNNNCIYLNTTRLKLQHIKCTSLFLNETIYQNNNTSLNFYWVNKGQIKTEKDNKCLRSVDIPIIKENNVKYYGYISINECNEMSEKWEINGNGNIINMKNKKCLVRDDNDFLVYLGDCVGNVEGYKGNEIFVIQKYEHYLKELFYIENLIKDYNLQKENLIQINEQHQQDLNIVMNISTDILNYKDKIEYIDKRLQKDMEIVEKTSVNNITEKLFDIYGIQTIIKGQNIIFTKEPCIYNGKIQRINPLDMFNGLQNKENNSYNYEINSTQDIIEFKGMIIINEEIEEGKFHINSNIGFLFIFNNKVLLSQNDEHFQKSNKTKFKSPTLSLVNKSIYPFQIIIPYPNSTTYFYLSFHSINDSFLSLHFIPFPPGILYRLSPAEIYTQYLKPLSCNDNFHSINLSMLFYRYRCLSNCEGNKNSICNIAYNEGIINKRGGIVKLNKNAFNNELSLSNNIYKFPFLACYNFYTEIKISYVKEYYEQLNKLNMFKEFQFIDRNGLSLNNKTKETEPLLLYKRKIISDLNEIVVIDFECFCDSSGDFKVNNNKKISKIIIKEIIRDPINGFCLILYKMKFIDFLNQYDIYPTYLNFIDIHLLNELEFLETRSKLLQNKFNIKFCSSSKDNNIIVFKYSYSQKIYRNNIIDNVNSFYCESYFSNNNKNEICKDKNIQENFLPRKGGTVIISDELSFPFNDLPLLVNYNTNYKIYLPSGEHAINSLIQIFISSFPVQNNKTSFIELNSQHNYIYSSNFLHKIEKAINSLSSKLISNSHYINEINNNNKLLDSKINRLYDNSTNSIPFLISHISHLNSTHSHLVKQINSKLKLLNSFHISLPSSNPFTLFSIIDSYYNDNLFSLTSKWYENINIPSSIEQHANIFSNTKLISTFLITSTFFQIEHFNFEFSFMTPTYGIFGFIFFYKDAENYQVVLMNNLSNSKREIKHIIVSNGNYKVINEIGCNTMVELFGTCIAYKLNEQNHIIFLCDNNHKCQLKINQIEVFIFENIYDISFKVGIGLNYIDNIQITNTSIFYNFNYIVPHYNKDISINITKDNEISTFIQNKIDVDNIKKKCLRYSLNNEGVCNYILKLINENNIDISNTGNIDFGQKIKLHCISKMNSIDICEQVYKKVFPVFIKLQKEFESPLRLISNGQSILSEDNKTNLKEIIKTCELKNGLKLLKSDNICFNEELLNTIKVYFLSTNKCLKEYCRFCCINIPNKTKYCDKYCIIQN